MTKNMPPIAILAGGLATRLHPITLTIPKSLVEVAGKPFIFHQLKLLKHKGISEVVLCVGKYGDQIQDYVGDGNDWGLKVDYSFDGPIQLGTGGALKKATKMLPDVFFVIYGDSYLDTDMLPVFEKFRAEGRPSLMTVYHNNNKYGKSNILFENGEIVRYDKVLTSGMEHIDYGLSLFEKKVFDEWPQDKAFDLSEVHTRLIQRKEVSAFEVSERFYEVGSHEGLKETAEYIKNKDND